MKKDIAIPSPLIVFEGRTEFWVRVEENDSVRFVTLKATSLPEAVREARTHGLEPLHHATMRNGKTTSITAIPASVL